MRLFRLAFLIALAALGFHIQGVSGAFFMLCIFAFLCLVWYLMCGVLFSFVNLFQRPPTTVHVTVQQGDSLKGHPDVEGSAKVRHPDPTRPSEDDFKVLTWRKPL